MRWSMCSLLIVASIFHPPGAVICTTLVISGITVGPSRPISPSSQRHVALGFNGDAVQFVVADGPDRRIENRLGIDKAGRELLLRGGRPAHQREKTRRDHRQGKLSQHIPSNQDVVSAGQITTISS